MTAPRSSRQSPARFGGGNPWDHLQEWDVELLGEGVRDPRQRRTWELATRLAGGLPYIWRELARPVSQILYGLLELRRGRSLRGSRCRCG